MTDSPLKRLFLSHRHGVHSYLSGKLRDPDLAADLTQEAFLRYAERSPAEVAQIRSDRSYLYRMAHNLAVDHLRQRGRQRTDLPGPETLSAVADDRPGQEAQTAGRQRLAQLRRILMELPERSRQIFALNRIGGLSYAEVAARLNISESSVQKHLARALLHVTQRLREEEEQS